MTVHDPACGTRGFLLSAYEHMRRQPGAQGPQQPQRKPREHGLSGTDIVDEDYNAASGAPRSG